jgi:hypothetical protein
MSFTSPTNKCHPSISKTGKARVKLRWKCSNFQLFVKGKRPFVKKQTG